MRCNQCSQFKKIKYVSNFGENLCEDCAEDLIYEPLLGGYIHTKDSRDFYLDDESCDITIYQEV